MKRLTQFIFLLLCTLVIPAATLAQPNPFGEVINPLPGGSLGPDGGLIVFLNNILRLIFTVGGIFAFFRIIISGFGFMNAGGDAKKIEVAWNGIWQALLGMVIIIASIAAGALMGLIFYGDATAILNPKIYGPEP